MRTRTPCKRLLGILLLIAFVTIGVAHGLESLPTCFVDLPVYDATGKRLVSQITAVTPEGERATDLLTIREAKYRVVNRGERLYFPQGLIGMRRIEVTLTGKGGRSIRTRIALMGCQQRVSLEDGILDREIDVSFSTVRGRVVGCRLAGDWWIRGMPMAGTNESPIIHEGFIDLADGVFSINSSFRGERHIFVIGKDNEPVRAFAVNVVSGGNTDAGTIDLRGLCPK